MYHSQSQAPHKQNKDPDLPQRLRRLTPREQKQFRRGHLLQLHSHCAILSYHFHVKDIEIVNAFCILSAISCTIICFPLYGYVYAC